MAEQRKGSREELVLIEAVGPWCFVTRRTYRWQDGSDWVWQSRHHRKRIETRPSGERPASPPPLKQVFWQPRQLNWWIGVIFSLGSTLFVLGSLLFLVPTLAQGWGFEANDINWVFFAGSLPFTAAAYLQLFQAANARGITKKAAPPDRTRILGWRPRDLGWLGCALQLIGTLLFNLNTFDALIPGLNWMQQDLAIWVPDFVGSLLFLASGYFAFAEGCHSEWAWQPKSLSWWVTFANLLGCVAFMISAFFAFVLPRQPELDTATISVSFTLVGATGFLVGSLLMIPETVRGKS